MSLCPTLFKSDFQIKDKIWLFVHNRGVEIGEPPLFMRVSGQ